MAEMKGLFKDTAIYGLSSMLGRFLNWCLTPMYTFYLAQGELGAQTNYYAGMALVMILLTMGLETGFFRFAGSVKENANKVYSTCLIAISSIALLFLVVVYSFHIPIADFINCGKHQSYVMIIALIVALDAIAAVPFASLRLDQHPLKFAGIKLFSIVLTIVLNVFLLVVVPKLIENGFGNLVNWFYIPDFSVGYILIANLIASGVTILLLLPSLLRVKFQMDFNLLKRIMKYSLPLVVLGLAGVMNQHLDKLIYPYLLSHDSTAWAQLGVYAANAKIAIILVMFTQAFRYAFEPFIFARSDAEDKRPAYASATKYFIISGLMIFLFVMLYLDIIKLMINPTYYEGLKVIPIIMLADLFNGVFFNLSLWYKLTDRTSWGAWFSLGGLVIIIVGNVCFVPIFGYMACAWSAFVCYFVLMVISYFMGQHYYKVPYPLKRIALYVVVAIAIYGISTLYQPENSVLCLAYKTLLFLVYVAMAVKLDMPLSQLPLVGKYFRKR